MEDMRQVVARNLRRIRQDRSLTQEELSFRAEVNRSYISLTNRRSYHLALESTERTAMAAISWTYPADELLALEARNSKAEAAAPVDLGISLENLRFRYAITGDNPPWRPVQAFDDGSKVYIQFPRRIDQGEMPPLFVVGPDGGNELVNYRVRGPTISSTAFLPRRS